MTGKVTVVVGGQFGSEAKGAVCSFLAREDVASGTPHVAVRVGGSQAGHTVYDDSGLRWPFRHLPVAAVLNPEAELVIAAGSEIDREVLADEVLRVEAVGYKVRHRLWIDPQATVIEDRHKEVEAKVGLTAKLGSTAKGVGAARADRIMRSAQLVGDDREFFDRFGTVINTADMLRVRLLGGAHVVIEGVQGYGLGLHAGYYPKCTSSDARAIDFLAMAGINPWQSEGVAVDVAIVTRAYPIRVAGNSGPLENETTWADLGLPEELTTVTQKVRRVGRFDTALVRNAVRANGGPADNVWLAVTMVDQRWRELSGSSHLVKHHPAASEWIDHIEVDTGAIVRLVGVGPESMGYYRG